MNDQKKPDERKAFMAGFKARHETPDIEKAWQQYRCQDDTDWTTVDDSKRCPSCHGKPLLGVNHDDGSPIECSECEGRGTVEKGLDSND